MQNGTCQSCKIWQNLDDRVQINQSISLNATIEELLQFHRQSFRWRHLVNICGFDNFHERSAFKSMKRNVKRFRNTNYSRTQSIRRLQNIHVIDCGLSGVSIRPERAIKFQKEYFTHMKEPAIGEKKTNIRIC